MSRFASFRIIFSVAALFTGTLGGTVHAQVKPLDDAHKAMGVMSCANSQCHSRQTGNGPVVAQYEIVVWNDETSDAGAHSRAYASLLSDQGKRIARNLGIGKAEEAAICLSCHAHNVAEANRGEQFDLAEGVTCEACHGNAGNWIETHAKAGVTHADNLAAGLYPTENVSARASLCLDCHVGSTRRGQFVTHRVMGAGHPRLSFELELFTDLQAHYAIDDDYRERKGVGANPIQSWAVGQAMAMARSASLMGHERIGRDGIFPELSFFDCHTCHQPVAADTAEALAGWRPNPLRPLGPGVPVYNDANMIMLQAVVAEVSPRDLDALKAATARLHRATHDDRSDVPAATARLVAIGNALQAKFAATDFDQKTTTRILNRILDTALSSQYTNYAAGEQAVIAVDVFTNAMQSQGMMDETTREAMQGDIDSAFRAVSRPETYSQDSLRGSLSRIRNTVRKI